MTIRITPQVEAALADRQLQRNLTHTLGKTLEARRRAVEEVENWEELRQHARRVKAHTLSHLDRYLEQLEENVERAGGRVVWAETAGEAVEFVLELAHRREASRIIKSKSMMSEEIHLNRELERAGMVPVETDLGEYIVQLAGETPSHIIAPALHKSRREIAQLFVEKAGMEPTEDVEQIARTARILLRRRFLEGQVGITGANFAVAETGSVVIVENEGNARLTTALPPIHVALMGIEKVIPRFLDLWVFLTLLSRSATGQRITSYVNLIRGSRREEERDGPREFYLVLIDNGRTGLLADPLLRQTLACIRCGACQNVCPVYQKLGGHAYGSTYQGPIGSILTPQLGTPSEAPEHPFASSLCGACREVCPVKIDIPAILLRLRGKVQQAAGMRAARLPFEKWAMQIWSHVMCHPALYRRVSRWGRSCWRLLGGRLPLAPLRRWSRVRELPRLPRHTFGDLYRRRGSR